MSDPAVTQAMAVTDAFLQSFNAKDARAHAETCQGPFGGGLRSAP